MYGFAGGRAGGDDGGGGLVGGTEGLGKTWRMVFGSVSDCIGCLSPRAAAAAVWFERAPSSEEVMTPTCSGALSRISVWTMMLPARACTVMASLSTPSMEAMLI